MVEGLADEILDQADHLEDSPFLINELLETQGTRMHFLTLLQSQLEASAEQLDEQIAQEEYRNQKMVVPPSSEGEAASPAPRKRKPRAKKLADNGSPEGSA
jgi:hypothetical protein